MTTPSDEGPPRSRRGSEPFLRDAAELAERHARDAMRSLPPPKPTTLPRWLRWAALVALISAVVRWIFGVRCLPYPRP